MNRNMTLCNGKLEKWGKKEESKFIPFEVGNGSNLVLEILDRDRARLRFGHTQFVFDVLELCFVVRFSDSVSATRFERRVTVKNGEKNMQVCVWCVCIAIRSEPFRIPFRRLVSKVELLWKWKIYIVYNYRYDLCILTYPFYDSVSVTHFGRRITMVKQRNIIEIWIIKQKFVFDVSNYVSLYVLFSIRFRQRVSKGGLFYYRIHVIFKSCIVRLLKKMYLGIPLFICIKIYLFLT